MTVSYQSARVPAAGVVLEADIALPQEARGVVLFAHGSGSSRHSPRNRYVAEQLQHAGLATVLADLLTAEEERIDALTAELRFDIGLLATRLAALTDWLTGQESTAGLGIGLFGASTGAAAALVAAAVRPAWRSSRAPRICSRNRARWSRWLGWPGTGSANTSHRCPNTGENAHAADDHERTELSRKPGDHRPAALPHPLGDELTQVQQRFTPTVVGSRVGRRHRRREWTWLRNPSARSRTKTTTSSRC
jgi:hypothetical protein